MKRTQTARATTLLDQVAHPAVLSGAYEAVRVNGGASGVDGLSLDRFGDNLATHLEQLSRELKGGWYAPLPVRRTYVPKGDGGRRVIGIPAVRDRIVARAIQRILTPQLERLFCRNSYAYRKGRSCRSAIQQVRDYLSNGSQYAVLLDIEDYFPSIDRALLLSFLEEELHHDPLVPVVGAMMTAGAVEEGRREAARGIEQGSPLSPLLANLYLHPWDRALTKRKVRWVRYSDNALLAFETREEATAALEEARADLARLGLKLNAEKSEVRSAQDGFPFLGFHLSSGGVGPELASLERLKAKLLQVLRGDGGRAPEERIDARRQVLQGWLNYYSNLSGVPVTDVWTLVAALRMAAQRKDIGAAKSLLHTDVRGDVPPEALQALRDACGRLGLDELLAPPDAFEPPPLPPGLPTTRATRVLMMQSALGGSTSISEPFKPLSTELDDSPEAELEHEAQQLLSRGLFREVVARVATFFGVDRARRLPSEVALEPEERGDEAETADAWTAEEESSSSPRARSSTPVILSPQAPNSVDAAPPRIHVTRGALSLLVHLFQGGNAHARMSVDSLGRRRYSPVSGPLDEVAWRQHLGGEETLALCPVREDGLLSLGVWDVDIGQPWFAALQHNPQGMLEALEAAHQYALRLRDAALKRGMDVLIEDSGQKGRHVWCFFAEPQTQRDVFRLLRLIRADAGPPLEPITCDTIPAIGRSTDAPQPPRVTLPLGIHLESGRRSLLLEPSGQPIVHLEAALARVRPVSSSVVRETLATLERPALVGRQPTLTTREHAQALSASVPHPRDPRLQAVLAGCPVMRHLVEKAGAIGHLNHRERLSLLAVLGHIEPEGGPYIHAVISQCANYNHRITEAHIQRRKDSPVSCARLREWLPDVVARVPCHCRFKVPSGAYPSPLLHAVPGTKGEAV